MLSGGETGSLGSSHAWGLSVLGEAGCALTLSPPPGSGSRRASALRASGFATGRPLLFVGCSRGQSQGTAKDHQTPCVRALWPQGSPASTSNFVVAEQAVALGEHLDVWPRCNLLAGQRRALGRGPLAPLAISQGRVSPRPWSVGPGEAPERPGSTLGWTCHT